VLLGALAYGCWGLFPAFFGLLGAAGTVEVLAHRVAWTFVIMVMVLLAWGRLRELRRIGSAAWRLAAAASFFIGVNWGVYIFAVTTGRVVEAALGYFINPLVSVLLGMALFRERLRALQAAAVAVAAVAVVVLTVDYGRPPVIALTLALTFAMYGLVKKVMPIDPRLSLAAEGVVALPLALGYLVFLAVAGGATFGSLGWTHTLLLIATGPVTALPLLLFGAAAQRVPLVTIGLLQYLTPTLQLMWGVAVVRESMPASRWAGFALIWMALALFTVDVVRRAGRRARAQSEVVGPGA
jgi:chloramphenicol-sensitive protein RarD